MTPKRYARVCELFEQAIGLPPGRRSAFVNQACAGDDELRVELERLLEGDSEDPGFLSAPCSLNVRSALPEALTGEFSVNLDVTAGPHQGKSFRFSGHDTFLVGRSKQAHFQLADKDRYFSRLHFMVEVNPPRCRIVDLGSHNGTFLNGQRVREAELHDGDEIKAGHTLLSVKVEGLESSTPESLTLSHHGGSGEPLDVSEMAPDPPVTEVETPPEISGYRLLRELGRGGMGSVYLATDERDGHEVALKMVHPVGPASKNQIARFLREASILENLDHPNIVRFHGMGQAEGRPYFVMEYVLGTDAGKLLKEQGPLPVRVAVRILCQVLKGLEHAHDRRFVHRDIKPANVLLATQDGKHAVKLADFGLARIYQASRMSGLTMSGDIGGTVSYLPPEQITHYREVEPPADQYSAAAMLYTLLTGKAVYDFGASKLQPLVLILQEDPVSILSRKPDLPAALAAVIHRALAREPGDRYPNVASFREALVPFGK